MTLASWITCTRIALIPVFAWTAIAYSKSIEAGIGSETLRWLAVGLFTIAAASDGLDGYVARKLDQKSTLGAVLDPLADKGLLLTATIIFTVYPWGINDWKLPLWFAVLTISRDCMILGGITYLYTRNGIVPIKPHWIGKACTVAQMITLGWIMLKIIPLSPLVPTIIAGLFIIASGVFYYIQGLELLRSPKKKTS